MIILAVGIQTPLFAQKGGLLGQQKYSAAEPLLLEGHTAMKQRAGKRTAQDRTVRLTQALEAVVQLDDAWDRREQAAEWRNQLARQKRRPNQSTP